MGYVTCELGALTATFLPSVVLLAIQSVVKTLLDADCQHFCDSTGLAPSQASPVLEQQFEVEPHQTTLSVDCCLTPLCLRINTIELLGVFDVRCNPRGNFLVGHWSPV